MARPSVVAEVRHKPGLDPFVGLSAERERETWTAHRKAPVGWSTPIRGAYELPRRSGAAAAAELGTRRPGLRQVQARALQAVDELYGSSTGTEHLCRAKAR